MTALLRHDQPGRCGCERTVHGAPHWTARSATIEDLLKPLLETSDGSTVRMTENALEVSYGGKQGRQQTAGPASATRPQKYRAIETRRPLEARLLARLIDGCREFGRIAAPFNLPACRLSAFVKASTNASVSTQFFSAI
jgi:hypothetical protein